MESSAGEYVRRAPEDTVLHQAVREGWPEVLAASRGRGGLPNHVHEEVRRYLACGVLRWGFTAARCEACEETVLVAFSCKTRGWCPSCAARRGHQTAAHLDGLLPWTAYRQWTLAVPSRLRWVLVKRPSLLRQVERCLVRSVFAWQRRRAKQLGVEGRPGCGAVAFTQLFNGHLGLQPHLHLLVPEAVFSCGEWVPLPPPSPEDVEAVLRRTVRRSAPAFEDVDDAWPEDGWEVLQHQAAQLSLGLAPASCGTRRGRRVAAGMGFSLHADTHVHPHDRQGLPAPNAVSRCS